MSELFLRLIPVEMRFASLLISTIAVVVKEGSRQGGNELGTIYAGARSWFVMHIPYIPYLVGSWCQSAIELKQLGAQKTELDHSMLIKSPFFCTSAVDRTI